jgi:hypothetical protein
MIRTQILTARSLMNNMSDVSAAKPYQQPYKSKYLHYISQQVSLDSDRNMPPSVYCYMYGRLSVLLKHNVDDVHNLSHHGLFFILFGAAIPFVQICKLQPPAATVAAPGQWLYGSILFYHFSFCLKKYVHFRSTRTCCLPRITYVNRFHELYSQV